MGTSAHQDQQFKEAVISNSLLEEAIDWIKSNMQMDEIFDEKEILAYAANFDPEEVFKESTLAWWAESNGYTKE